MSIVFLHGFLGNAADWDEVRRFIPDSLSLHLPGHGGVPFIEDIFSYLRDSLPPNPHLIGYSMGGRIALQYADKFPVASLTLISTHLGLKSEEEKKKRRESDQKIAQELIEMPIDQFLKRWYDQPLFRSLKNRRDLLSLRKTQNPQELAKALCAFSLGRQSDYSGGLPENTRIILGEWDDAYRKQYEHIPHELVLNSGHAIHLEQPDALARLLCKK